MKSFIEEAKCLIAGKDTIYRKRAYKILNVSA